MRFHDLLRHGNVNREWAPIVNPAVLSGEITEDDLQRIATGIPAQNSCAVVVWHCAAAAAAAPVRPSIAVANALECRRQLDGFDPSGSRPESQVQVVCQHVDRHTTQARQHHRQINDLVVDLR